MDLPLEKLKKSIRAIENCFVIDRITEADVITQGESLEKKIRAAQDVEGVLERIRSCKTPGQVFLEFANDAAAAKVDEMLFGRTSEARQRAQETVLEYALGKPINRNMSLSMKIPEAADEELEHDIRNLLVELGFSTGEGKTSQIFMGPKGTQRQISASELPSEPGISAEVHSKPEEN